jgi:hypothetical protein
MSACQRLLGKNSSKLRVLTLYFFHRRAHLCNMNRNKTDSQSPPTLQLGSMFSGATLDVPLGASAALCNMFEFDKAIKTLSIAVMGLKMTLGRTHLETLTAMDSLASPWHSTTVLRTVTVKDAKTKLITHFNYSRRFSTHEL